MQRKISLCLGKRKFIPQSNTAISLNEQVIILYIGFIGFSWSGIEDYTGTILLKLTKSFESVVYMYIAVSLEGLSSIMLSMWPIKWV